MKRKSRTLNDPIRIALPAVFLVVGLYLGGCNEKKNNENSLHHNEKLVYDYAEFLDLDQKDFLQKYLDSIRQKMDVEFVYCSLDNFEQLNTDSIAALQFKNFWLSDNGVLIFLSRGTVTAKILVGKKIHREITDSELTEITKQMIPYFREGFFYQGLKAGFSKIALKIEDSSR